jgi:hypothetical protein
MRKQDDWVCRWATEGGCSFKPNLMLNVTTTGWSPGIFAIFYLPQRCDRRLLYWGCFAGAEGSEWRGLLGANERCNITNAIA